MADIRLSNIIHVSQERRDNNLSVAGMICKLNSSHSTRKKEGKEKRGGRIPRDFILHNITNINTHRQRLIYRTSSKGTSWHTYV